MPHRLQTLAPWLLVLAVFAVYWNSLDGAFVYDDVFLIVENPQIRDSSSLPEIFTSGFWESSSRPNSTYYRPLVTTSYWLNYLLGGLEPTGFHLANVLLHCLNVLLVFVLTRRLTGSLVLALVTSGMFGLHPVNTEAVAWISGRTDVSAALFILLAINMHVISAAKEDGGRGLAWIGWGAFALALLAKEIAVTLILLIALHDLLFSRESRLIRDLLPYLGILGVYLLWRWEVLGGFGQGATDFVFNFLIEESAGVRVLTAFKIFGMYLLRFVWPWPLSVDYSFHEITAVRTPLDPGFLIPLVILILLIGAVVATWRRRPIVAFGISWFLGTGSLIFMNAIFPYGVLFAERFVYLPGIGLALATASLLAAATLERPVPRGVPFVLAAIAVLTVNGWRTIDRNRDWTDNFELFSSAVRVSPLSTVSHGNLATELYRLGRFDEAEDHYRRAVEIYPGFVLGHRGLGYVALAEDDAITALGHFRQCEILAPDDEETHIALATALMRLERFAEARQALEYALLLNPRTAKTYHNLGFIASGLGDIDGAIRYYEQALTIDPTAPQILLNLGISYESQGRMSEAREMFERFLATPPGRFEKQKQAVRRRLSGS